MNNCGHQTPELDIVIPVYNEGENILPVLESFKRHVTTPCRVLICYDHESDNTLPAVRAYPQDASRCNWSRTVGVEPWGQC